MPGAADAAGRLDADAAGRLDAPGEAVEEAGRAVPPEPDGGWAAAAAEPDGRVEPEAGGLVAGLEAVDAVVLGPAPSPFSDFTRRVTSASDTEEEWPFTGIPSATNFSTVSFEDSPKRFATS